MRTNKSGFTLVEILLSAAIFSIVAVAVYRVFSVAMKANERVDRSLKMDLDILSTFHDLECDLNNIVSYRPFEGSADGLSMAVGQNDGLAVVRYQTNEKGDLLRSESALSDVQGIGVPSSKGQRILSDLKSVRFSFGYINSDGQQIVWKDAWYRNSLPFAVRLDADVWTGPDHRQWMPLQRTIFIPHGEWGQEA